ncbi:MAG: penicillin-binding protein 1C [Desulfovibrio sp.]|nr:MAG: penicillin-binding protein 1C [Desulfovibrio sp.]
MLGGKWSRRACLGLSWLVLLGFGAFFLLDSWFPFPARTLAPQAATVVLDRDGEPLRLFLPQDDRWRFQVSIDEVSPLLIECFLASEDHAFERHPGVNPFAVLRAAFINLRELRVVSGGSTITMQVARLAEPKERTLAAKIVEAFRAVQLEREYSKEDILESYLNMTPYGGNIVGVGAASYFYFGTTPDKLTLEQCALLTVLPRSPNRFDPVRHPELAKAVRDDFLDQLANRGVFPREWTEAAKNQPLPESLRRPPMVAPHLAQWAVDEYGRQPRLHTTIDRYTQLTVQAKLADRASWLRGLGLENAAVVVIDNETRELLAMAGSTDFFDDAHHGQINGALIKRSPGSALKPFLYALAMDQGHIVPQSILLDIPTEFAGYTPRNYDNTYSGRVTVEEALIRSLNTPVVRLLSETGLVPYYTLLDRGGLTTLDRPAQDYGLPLALGACEVRLLDLAGMYAALGQGGEFREVRMLMGDPVAGERLLSPESCRLVTDILAQVERSDMPAAWRLTRDLPEIAWKTGTSFGHRDAWALGFTANYTIGVWVGNLDGRAQKGISGARHAGPILFDLFRALEQGGTPLDRPFLPNIETLEVCAESRHLPTPHCEERMEIAAIRGVTRLPRDTMHRRMFLDNETGLRLEGNCLMHRDHYAEIVRVYPAELTAWWRDQGMNVRGLPPLHPTCNMVADGEGPAIVSPNPLTPYYIRSEAPAEFQSIALSAQCGAETRQLYWYQDGALVGSGPPEKQLFLVPERGEHRLVVMDDLGRMDAVEFIVQ